MSKELIVWSADAHTIIPKKTKAPGKMVPFAVQLSARDQKQVVQAFSQDSYEMASSFIWRKAIAFLRKRLASLGMDFVGQMLNRLDIDEHSSIDQSVTDYELISLAEDLGLFSSTLALRLRQVHEMVSHFENLAGPEAETEEMDHEEALKVLRTSINAILGQQQIELPSAFIEFRKRLSSKSIKSDSRDVSLLRESPEFFKRTTLSILLSQLKSAQGAAAEHIRANVTTLLPAIWDDLPATLRWQVGHAYAELHSEGPKQVEASIALSRALKKVQGYDYVPENLRSQSYVAAAQEILRAHQGVNNYYTEPPAVRNLMALGSSVPMPAMPNVMAAIIAVYIGKFCGHSWQGASEALSVMRSLDTSRWSYYINTCLIRDRIVLAKLSDRSICKRWCDLVIEFELGNEDTYTIKSNTIRRLLKSSSEKKYPQVEKYAEKLYERLTKRS